MNVFDTQSPFITNSITIPTLPVPLEDIREGGAISGQVGQSIYFGGTTLTYANELWANGMYYRLADL